MAWAVGRISSCGQWGTSEPHVAPRAPARPPPQVKLIDHDYVRRAGRPQRALQHQRPHRTQQALAGLRALQGDASGPDAGGGGGGGGQTFRF
eukprot:3752353-Pyramimonas_sp.AAC.1